MLFNSVHRCFNRAVYDQGPHDAKLNLAAAGFEPTPPKRLVTKTSALDRSATLPDALSICPKHWKSSGAYYISVLTG